MKPARKLAFAVLEEFSQGVIDSARLQQEIEERVANALDQGYQRGLAAGRAEALADFDRRLTDLTTGFEADMSAARQSWQHDTGARLLDAMLIGIKTLSETFEGRIAALLKPLLQQKIYDQAVIAFHDAVDRAVAEGATVEISGSEPLVGGVQERLAGKVKILTLTPSDDASVVVKIDDAIISANFSAWAAQLEGPSA